jgi:cytochrome c553
MPRSCPPRGALLLAIVASACTAGPARAAGDAPPSSSPAVDFERDIRPILSKSCLRCHGAKKQEGGLRLHAKGPALAGGDTGPAIVPGKSAESRLVRYVSGLDEDHVMPPEGTAAPLSDEQVGLLRAWIDAGASWPETPGDGPVGGEHWAFRRPVRPDVPEVRRADWARTPIDRFVLARLEAEGIAPADEAGGETLLRRATLDLTGLPPTPAERAAFLADARPDAYERLVDRLLASPRYGERWARRWLDRARYADTNGYEKDRPRPIWPYRDWVIRALNADLPFDRFTIDQIAGDLLPDATLDQRIATGFHRNTMINEEGGIDVAEFRHAAVVDRVHTTATAWLGLTLGCAQCHSHKFDPFTHREYYRFFALLDNADEPEIPLPDPLVDAERADIEARVATLEAGREARFPGGEEARARAFASWLEAARGKAVAWTPVAPAALVSRKGATFDVLPDRSVLVSGDKPNNDVYELEIPLDGAVAVTAIRLEALPHESLPDGGPGRAPLFSVGDFILTNVEAEVLAGAPDGSPRPLKFASATEDYAEAKRSAALAIDGDRDTGWSVKGATGRPHAAVFALDGPVAARPGDRLRLVLHQFAIHQMTLGRFRVSLTAAPGPVVASGMPAEVEDLVVRSSSDPAAAASPALRAFHLAIAPELAEPNAAIERLRRSLPARTETMVMRERRPEHRRTTRIHIRGDYLRPGEPVEPGVPAVLPPLPEGVPADRLALARWLVAPENPLAARVLVNTTWSAFFGRGLVGTPEDFGTRGERPTHPELLDWLATEAVRLGWSQKALHRLIVTSAVYRQASATTPERIARDPRNELLGRGPRFRVEAEAVRDLALAVSGLLAERVGGPSVHPPQPEGVTALAYGNAAWPTSTGPDRYRRGLYTFLKRTAPYASFATFDQPTSEVACVRRERSNTPLQALTLLNDPVFVEASRALALRVLREGPGTESGRIEHAFVLCLGRAPRPNEAARVAAYLAAQRAAIAPTDATALAGAGRPGEVDPAEAAAWTALARVLLNLDETITRE